MKQDTTSLAIQSMVGHHKVAVVGNGGILLDKEDGDLIDSYETVIRMNSFQIKDELVKHSGKKTTIWANAMHHKVPFKEENEYEHIVCPLPLDVPHRLKRYGATNRQMLQKYSKNTLFMPENYFAELTTRLINPSTGIAMLFWLHKEQIPFDIFGFSFFNKKHAHHYHDTRSVCGHDGNGEQKFFESCLKC